MCIDLFENSSGKKNWLVTGAAGFIGSHVAENLLKNGQTVVGLDNFSTGSRENLGAIKYATSEDNLKNFKFIEGDICNFETCREATENIDFVLHQAALGSVPRSIIDPITTNSTNINGFLNILKASVDNQVTKFVFAASSSTYGDHPALPKIETEIGRPLSPYAVTKYVNELYAEVFSRLYDIQCVGLRYFNVFGPRQDPNGAYAAVIPKWINALLTDRDLIIHGDGSTTRDFCYVDNVTQANIRAALSDQDASSKVYNIAYGERTSLKELAIMLKHELKRIQINSQSNFIYEDFRKGDILHSLADIREAKNHIEYDPTVNVKEGLSKTVEWFARRLQRE